MVVKVINSIDEFRTLINGEKPVMIDFWATWCGPCKAISPIFERLSNEHEDKADFYKVDVDEQEAISQEVGIRAMPTFLLFHKGEKAGDVVGARPEELQKLVTVKAASLTA